MQAVVTRAVEEHYRAPCRADAEGRGLGAWAGALAFEGRSEEWGLLRFALRPPPRTPSAGASVVFRLPDTEVTLSHLLKSLFFFFSFVPYSIHSHLSQISTDVLDFASHSTVRSTITWTILSH